MKDDDDATAYFQNQVRDTLLAFLQKNKIPGDIDGGGCDSGDWRDFTLSELNQGLNAIQDWLDETPAQPASGTTE